MAQSPVGKSMFQKSPVSYKTDKAASAATSGSATVTDKPKAKATVANTTPKKQETKEKAKVANPTPKKQEPTKKTESKPATKKSTAKHAISPFGKAFAEARKSGAKEFTFGGKKYNTKIKGE